jgi:hypothetical protein
MTGTAMRDRLRAMGVVGCTLVLLAMACGGSPPSTPIGTVVADAGFRPPNNGFPFENYGAALSNGDTPTNLTAADVQLMFGDGVCAEANSRRCDLIPEAQAWLDSTNEVMAGGHCYGLSVAAELLWQRKLNVNTLGAAATTALDIDNNQALQRLIAYDWALQLLDSVQTKRINGTPNQILAKLKKLLKPNPSETYTIVIWKPDGTGGHAVTPYAVQYEGGGKFKVLIYDNNWPGATRAVLFDTKADTWTYDAAINPSRPDEIYQGDAKTKTLSLYPTSPGLGTQPCPFCGKVPSALSSPGAPGSKSTEEIYLAGSPTNHADLVVTDDAGHRLGYINGALVDEIRGAHVEQLASNQDWTNRVAPHFFVPADARYTISIDGTKLTNADTETVGIIGPSFDLSVNDIPMNPGDTDTLVAEPDATKVSYTSSRAESPTLKLGVSDYQAAYSFEIGGVSDQPGSTINLSLPAEGGSLTMQNVGQARASGVDLKMTRSTKQGSQVFSHDAISLAGGDTAEVQFGRWTGTNGDISLVTTHGGQRSTQRLTNQSTG